MIIHKFLTATTAACAQAHTSIPSTAGPFIRPLGVRMAGGAGSVTGVTVEASHRRTSPKSGSRG